MNPKVTKMTLRPELDEQIRAIISEQLKGQLQSPIEDRYKLFTKEEACRILRCTMPTLDARIKAGDILAKRFGRRVLLTLEDILRAPKAISFDQAD
ncbi:MAG TPA: hypothetical protein P5228_08125 [Bacteroidales bacterium]|nr:hypothetical protein [Bacteroidales bacterium]HRZ49178.1 hypothetical protein [Bacteroidales bacterium]